MATIELPIPATDAPLTRGQLYQLTGLTASTRYKFTIVSSKLPKVTIAKEEALTTIQAQGYLNGTAFYFSTDAGQTSAYLLVEALEGAIITLTMEASPVPAPVDIMLPATVDPDKWYHVSALTSETMYELKVSSDTLVTVFSKTGEDLDTAIDNPPLTTQAGSTYFVAAGEDAWFYVDGASSANVNIAPYSGVSSMPTFYPKALTGVDGGVELVGPLPAGYYAVDIVTHCNDAAFKMDGTINILSDNVSYEEFSGIATAGGTALEPLFSVDKVITGKNLRGRFIVSLDTPLGPEQFKSLAFVTPPTGAAETKFYGWATASFVGNIV